MTAKPKAPTVAELIRDWPAELKEELEERAAIIEDGCKVTREASERRAFALLVGQARDAQAAKSRASRALDERVGPEAGASRVGDERAPTGLPGAFPSIAELDPHQVGGAD